MYHEVDWNDEKIMKFAKLAKLAPEEIEIIKMRYEEIPTYVIADKLGVSPRTIARRVKIIKKKYDNIVFKHPELFEPRQFSREYYAEYTEFDGKFKVRTPEDEIYLIDFKGKKFTSFEEVKQYIVSEMANQAGKEFSKLGKIHIKIEMGLFIDLTPKR